MDWDQWIASVWGDLAAGRRAQVPTWLPHPRESGFEAPPLAEPAGQSADWVKSYSDGSRVHVHEFANGTFLVHRDATDPKRSPAHAAWHWLSESTSGRVVAGLSAGLGVVFTVVKLVGEPEKPRRRHRK